MKRNLQIIILQSILVLLMSALVSFTLQPLAKEKYYVLFIVFGVLTVVGFTTIFSPRFGPLPFGLPVFLTAIPAIINFNLLDLGFTRTYTTVTFFGTEYSVPDVVFEELSPSFQFAFVLGLGLFIMAGYFALSYLNSLQVDYRAMLSGEAEKNEIEVITGKNIGVLFVFLAAVITLTVIITVILRVIQSAATDYLNNFPWAVLVLGLAGILILAGFLYWSGRTRKKETQ